MGGVTGASTGIVLASLQEAFVGNEEILGQMFALFEPQTRERMAKLEGLLVVWDAASMRTCLHSLVNIAGAVHAYGMAEQAKALGEAVKRDDRGMALLLLEPLRREADLVLRQAGAVIQALAQNPASVWTLSLPD